MVMYKHIKVSDNKDNYVISHLFQIVINIIMDKH